MTGSLNGRRNPWPPAQKVPGPVPETKKKTSASLNNRERRELEKLPARIEELEAEQKKVSETISHPDFYVSTPEEEVNTALKRLETVQEELAHLYTRWEALEARKT